jgi:hypothetical protein
MRKFWPSRRAKVGEEKTPKQKSGKIRYPTSVLETSKAKQKSLTGACGSYPL